MTKELAALYSGTVISVVIIAVRLSYRIRRRQRWVADDWIVCVATAILMLRLGFNHVILLWGTNAVSPEQRMRLTGEEIQRRELASKMNIAVKLCYTSYLWLMKFCLLMFYQRLVATLPAYDVTVKSFWAILVTSYVAIVLVSFLECRPFHLFWQVVPNPGTCEKAIIKTYLLGILNIITDVLLFIFPLPIVFNLRASFAKKLRLYALLCVGILVILITMIRLPRNISKDDSLANKIFWCSFEIAAATLVANACVIYSMVGKRKERTGSKKDVRAHRDFEAFADSSSSEQLPGLVDDSEMTVNGDGGGLPLQNDSESRICGR